MKTLQDIQKDGWESGINQVWHGDCLDFMKLIPDGSINMILTDPPYPDYYQEEYGYKDEIIEFLKNLSCRQFVFWSAKVEFPLDYTAIHIWNKQRGIGSEYERIFERNGNKNYKLFTAFSLDSYRAKIAREVWTEHPSQKPIKLIQKIINEFSKENDIILDPFLGSGTTAVAAKQLGRRFIGIEISERYCRIAEDRLRQGILFQ